MFRGPQGWLHATVFTALKLLQMVISHSAQELRCFRRNTAVACHTSQEEHKMVFQCMLTPCP